MRSVETLMVVKHLQHSVAFLSRLCYCFSQPWHSNVIHCLVYWKGPPASRTEGCAGWNSGDVKSIQCQLWRCCSRYSLLHLCQCSQTFLSLLALPGLGPASPLSNLMLLKGRSCHLFNEMYTQHCDTTEIFLTIGQTVFEVSLLESKDLWPPKRFFLR